MWNKDEIKGKSKQISGTIKDKTGELIEDPKLEAKGERERIGGKLQENSGKTRRKTGEAVKKAAKRLPANIVCNSCNGFVRFSRRQIARHF